MELHEKSKLAVTLSYKFHCEFNFSCQLYGLSLAAVDANELPMFPHYSSLTPPGKPPTWFPGEGLVTQARTCHLLSDMSSWNPILCPSIYQMSFEVIFKISNFTSIFICFWNFTGIYFFRALIISRENLHSRCQNISN